MDFLGWLAVGFLLGAGFALAVAAALDEARLVPPEGDAVLPPQFRQAWRT